MPDHGVHKTEIKLGARHYLGCLTLDNPRALNALRLDMVVAMRDALQQWETRDEVIAILIDASIDKAFCAGGDIVNLYRAGTGEIEADYPDRFFANEYRLCYDLRQLTTPCIAWGHGIVMGGGMGVFSAASHRVVTPTTRLAMPEIKIGLFPDCCATWFFNRVPAPLGRFLALTGAVCNADDALFAGLADYGIGHEAKPQLVEELSTAIDRASPHAAADQALRALEDAAPAGQAARSRLAAHTDTLRHAAGGSDLVAIVDRLSALDRSDDPWLAEAGANLRDGCPVTAHLIFRQLETGRYRGLADIVCREFVMGRQCCAHPDFAEGVRALLVDKDNAPHWRFETVRDVPADYVDAHFTSDDPLPESVRALQHAP